MAIRVALGRVQLALVAPSNPGMLLHIVPEVPIDVLRQVCARSKVRLAVLFGSVARGTAHERSDVDLAVEVAQGVELATLASELSLAAGREVDLVRLADAGVPLLEELLREGIVVYEVPHAAARWRAHALADLEIDRPWYARMRDAWLRRVAERGLSNDQS